jgi:hypothetical protein
MTTTPNTVAQLSPQPASPGAVISPAAPNSPKNPSSPAASPFVSGVILPLFPGTVPLPAAGQSAPLWPLVEVPTPGLRAAKVRNPLKLRSPVLRRRLRRRIMPQS